MTNENKILLGEFKEIPIRIDSGSISGGRKFVKKEFPNRNTQTIEDLGLQPRSYQLDIVISNLGKTQQEPGEDYFDYRDRLISAIENKGPGKLVHPLYGTIENIIATTYSLNENLSEFGRSILSVTFEQSEDTGIPVRSSTAISQIAKIRNEVDAIVRKVLGDVFIVNTRIPGNFIDAQNKVNEIIESAIEATSFIGATADKINEFNRFIGQLSDNVNSLIVAPNALALSISNLFSNIDGLFGTAENTVKSFFNLFSFGNNDEDNIDVSTAGLVQRKNNRAILNQAVNAEALSFAMTAAVQLNFETVAASAALAVPAVPGVPAVPALPTARATLAEIELVENELEEQYQFIISNSDSNQEINTALTEMRIVVQDFFDEERISAKQVISIFTNITSARLLSYQYYEESESAVDIIALNKIKDVSFVEGDIDILTV